MLSKDVQLYLLYLSIDVLKDSRRNVRTSKMMLGVGSYQLFEILQ